MESGLGSLDKNKTKDFQFLKNTFSLTVFVVVALVSAYAVAYAVADATIANAYVVYEIFYVVTYAICNCFQSNVTPSPGRHL